MHTRGNNEQWIRQPMNWETVFASYVPEKQSISAIDKDVLCANNNNETNT